MLASIERNEKPIKVNTYRHILVEYIHTITKLGFLMLPSQFGMKRLIIMIGYIKGGLWLAKYCAVVIVEFKQLSAMAGSQIYSLLKI